MIFIGFLFSFRLNPGHHLGLILGLIFSITTSITATYATQPLQISPDCISFQFATRTGKKACWTQLHLTQNQRLCVSQALWLQWLESATSNSICAAPELPWKKLSFFKNDPHALFNLPNYPNHLLQPLTDSAPHLLTYQIRPQLRLQPKTVLLTKKVIALSQLTENGRSVDSTTDSKTPFTLRNFIFASIKKIERLREKISTFLAADDSLFILRSLILNEGNSKEPLPFLRKLGFVHLLSPSGIHLYAVAYLLHQTIRYCIQLIISRTSKKHLSHTTEATRTNLIQNGFLIQIGLWMSRILSLIVCTWIWLLSGTRLGLLRPWFVILTKSSSQFFGFRWNRIIPLILALCLEMTMAKSGTSFWHSSSGLNTGRWIYTLAVAGGLFWHPHFKSVHLGLAIGSWVPIALWEGWEHGSLSLATPLLSLITLPIVCLGIYPLILVSIFFHLMHCSSLAQSLLHVLSSLLEILIHYTAQFALYPGNLWILPQWSLLAGFILAVCLSLLSKPIPKTNITNFNIFYFKSFPITFILIFILIGIRFLIAFCNATNHHPTSSIPAALTLAVTTPVATRVEQLDVGQGDSALIQSSFQKFKKLPKKRKELHYGLIDTGSEHSLSDAQWFEVFSKRNITQLNWVALSHLDEDHIGGLHRLARLLPIRCVAIPDLLIHTQRGEKLRQQLLPIQISLTTWEAGCIPFPGTSTQTVFKKQSKYHIQSSRHSNQVQNPGNTIMGTLLIPLQKGGFYLAAGDATQSEENQIAAWVHTQLNTHSLQPGPRILKLSHHGSKTSTSLKWLYAIQPTEIWISVGLENRYHHPHPIVLKILENYGIPVYRTDQLGILRWI